MMHAVLHAKGGSCWISLLCVCRKKYCDTCLVITLVQQIDLKD